MAYGVGKFVDKHPLRKQFRFWPIME